MLLPLLEAPRRLLGRLVAPAIVVALTVCLAGETCELLGERALAELRPFGCQAEAVAVALEIPVGHETLEIRLERRLRHGEEARQLGGGGPIAEAFRRNPVHRLQHVVADAQDVELAHSAASSSASFPIAATAGASGS